MAVLNLRKKYKDEVIGKLFEKYKYGNKMSVPMLKKIVLNRGVGEAVNNSKSIQITMDQMWAITGQ